MKIKELQGLIERKEGKNPNLLYENAHLFLRICGRNSRIVELLQKVIESCRRMEPLNADYAIEAGHQLLMLGQID